MARGNFHVLPGLPRRDRAVHFGSAPGKRREHPAAATRQHGNGRREIAATHVERLPRIQRRLNRRCQRLLRRVGPAHDVEAHGVGHASIAADAHAQQGFVERVEFGGDALRRRARFLGRAADEILHPIECALSCVSPRAPFGAALRNERDQAFGNGRARLDRIALDDGALERFQRRDLAHAHVALAGHAVQFGRRHRAQAQQHGEQHRHDRDARGDRKVEERGASVTHGPLRAGSR